MGHTHTQVEIGTREEPVRVPTDTFRYIAEGDGGSSVRKDLRFRFVRTLGAYVKPARKEKEIRLTCDLIGDRLGWRGER